MFTFQTIASRYQQRYAMLSYFFDAVAKTVTATALRIAKQSSKKNLECITY